MGSQTDRLDHRLVLIVSMGIAAGGLVALTHFALSPLPLLLVLAIVGTGVFGLNPLETPSSARFPLRLTKVESLAPSGRSLLSLGRIYCYHRLSRRYRRYPGQFLVYRARYAPRNRLYRPAVQSPNLPFLRLAQGSRRVTVLLFDLPSRFIYPPTTSPANSTDETTFPYHPLENITQ